MTQAVIKAAVVLETPDWRRRIRTPLEDDVRFERFFRATRELVIDTVRFGSFQEIEPAPAQPRLAVLCLAGSDVRSQELATTLDILARRSEPVIVCADGPGEWADVPVDWCHRGLVKDFLLRETRAPNSVLATHAVQLSRNDPIYPPIRPRPRSRWRRTPSVFIATPLGEKFEVLVEGSLVPAIRKAGFEPQWCLSHREGRNFQEKVRDQIRGCALFIALVPQDAEPRQLHSVYYEAGFATAWKKRALIAIEAGVNGAQDVPVDLVSLERVFFDNPIDLALQVYFGLR